MGQQPDWLHLQVAAVRQLRRHCTPISGATAQSYTPVAGDVGHTIRVEETASNEGGPGTPATSEPTAVVKPALPENTKAPTITGDSRSRAKN